MANLSNINNVLRVSSNLRVGINTDAASYALEIGGTNSGIKLKNSDATNGRVYSLLSDTSGNFQIYDDAAASGRLVISSGGSATFAGNTTAPKVIVSGSTNNYATAPVVYFDSTSTANPGVRDWAIGPADDDYGNFHIFVGASTGADPVGTAGQVLTITNAGNATFAGNVNISSPGDFYINSGTSYNNKGSIFMSNQRTEIVSDIVNLTANGDTSLNFKTRSGGATASAIFIDEFRNSTFTGDVTIKNSAVAKLKAAPLGSNYGAGFNVMTVTGTSSAPYTSTIGFSNYSATDVLKLVGTNATFAGDVVVNNSLSFSTNGFADFGNIGTGAMRFKPSGNTLALTLTGANATFAGDLTMSSGAINSKNLLFSVATLPANNTPSINLRNSNNEFYWQMGTANTLNIVDYNYRNTIMGIAQTSTVIVANPSAANIQNPVLFLKTNVAGYNAGISFINNGNTNSYNDLAGIASFIDSGDAKGRLEFWTRNTDGANTDVATRMTIKANGNVGIGTTSPTGVASSGPGGNTTLDVQGPLKNKRVMRGWYHCGPITSTNAYRHIKTNLWMGGSPAGNTEYIMGGFEVKGYGYYGSYPGFGHGTCMFHNWSGGFASLQVANYGTAGFMQSPYKSSDGYCVIVLRQNTYMQPVIDFSQYYTPYPWRTSYVTAETTSNNLTGVY